MMMHCSSGVCIKSSRSRGRRGSRGGGDGGAGVGGGGGGNGEVSGRPVLPMTPIFHTHWLCGPSGGPCRKVRRCGAAAVADRRYADGEGVGLVGPSSVRRRDGGRSRRGDSGRGDSGRGCSRGGDGRASRERRLSRRGGRASGGLHRIGGLGQRHLLPRRRRCRARPRQRGCGGCTAVATRDACDATSPNRRRT